jgi:hypothetical protein
LLSLYGILDRRAPIHHRNGALREQWTWGPDEAVGESDVRAAIARLSDPTAAAPATKPVSENKQSITRAELTRLLSAANTGWKAAIEKTAIKNEQRVTRREFAAVCTTILAMPR